MAPLKAVRRRFPKHRITEVVDPMYANVRGFQLLGEQFLKVGLHSVLDQPRVIA